MKMKIHLLGTGVCAPTPDRMPACYFLEVENASFLIDPGPGAVNRMVASGFDPFSVDAIVISHLHLDHIADLPYYLFSYRNGYTGKKDGVTILGPPAFKDFFEPYTKPIAPWVFEPGEYEVRLRDLADAPINRNGILVSSTKVSHGADAVAIRFEQPGGSSLVYSGDTGYCSNLVELARGADVLLCECSWPDGYDGQGHMRPAEVARTASEAGIERLILTHFYPIVKTDSLPELIREHGYAGEIIVGYDGLTVEI